MAARPLELEGTWEEIVAHAPELAGRRVRLTVLPEEMESAPEAKAPAFRPARGPSTARSLLRYAGTWEGNDLEERLEEVYANRTNTRF
ncbi:MAG: hypothetical protein HY320_06370 [Armatimonadetes bacterium]|nr:hypothetical protein [Armatimonadota bacterium]